MHEGRAEERPTNLTPFPFSLFCSGGLIPWALRTAHAEGGGSHVVATTEGRSRFPFPFVLLADMYGGSTYPFGMNGPHQKRETINK